MRRVTIILTITILTIGCFDNSKEKNVSDQSQVTTLDTTQNDSIITKEIKSDISTKPAERTKTKKNEGDIVDFTGTKEVKVTLNEIEIINSNFYRQLDSLIRWEKKCSNSTLKELHWMFHPFGKEIYELTAASDFGGKYNGYIIIDNSVVFLAPDLPDFYRVTNKAKEFKFENKKFPYPEDYSVWIFESKEKKMKIIKSYTLPCN
jgi:hypothetical protein